MTTISSSRGARAHAIDAACSIMDRLAQVAIARYPDLVGVLRTFKDAPATGCGFADYFVLYRHIVIHRPRAILELGAGLSTAVISAAIGRAGYSPKFVAIEESAKWIEQHRRVIGPELLARVELLQLPAEAAEIGGRRAAHYIGVPRHAYEFVHIDGPGLIDKDCTVSGDLIEILPALAPACRIKFDGREDTSRFVRPALEREGFRFKRDLLTLSHEFWR